MKQKYNHVVCVREREGERKRGECSPLMNETNKDRAPERERERKGVFECYK